MKALKKINDSKVEASGEPYHLGDFFFFKICVSTTSLHIPPTTKILKGNGDDTMDMCVPFLKTPRLFIYR